MTPERKTFAGIRPLPPFGRIIKSLVEALEMTDPATYDGNPPTPQLLETLRIDGTTHRYAQGDLLKDATKLELLTAVAVALARLGWLPFREVPTHPASPTPPNCSKSSATASAKPTAPPRPAGTCSS